MKKEEAYFICFEELLAMINFFQIMREYNIEPGLAYNVATTEDFQRIAERCNRIET